MGSKGGTTVMLPQAQSQTSSVTPNPVALAGYANVVGQAQDLQAQHQGFTPDQQQAFNQVQQLQGVANPWINQAGQFAGQGLAAGNQLIQQGANAGSPQNFGQNINAYMSPYMDDVVKATMANINETNAQQQSQLTGNAIAQGAMGGNRVGVAGSELARQQNLTNNSTLAQILQQGYGQAGQNLFQNAGLQMQAGNSLGSLGNQTAGIYSGLGNEQLSTGLQGTNALLQTGGMQQALPYQQLGWLSGIVNNTGPNMGQTGTQNSFGYTSQYAPSPNPLNSILGAGVSIAGALAPAAMASDRRVKEDIHEVGKLHDGQKIYSFRYKGHPETQVGLMAQDVEKRHPEAVGEMNGVKTVDYKEATQDAIRKARGGGLGVISKAHGGGLGGEYDPSYNDYDSPVGGGFGAIPAVKLTGTRGLQLPQFHDLQQPHQAQQEQDRAPSFADDLRAGRGLRGAYDRYQQSADTSAMDSFAQDYASEPTIGNFGEWRGGRVRGYDEGGEVVDDSGGLGAGIDDPTFARMIKQESGGRQFDRNGQPLTSPKGAVGVAQIMPGTAPEAFALAGIPWDENRYRNDPDANMKAGAAYYKAQLDRFGDPEKAAAAYNAGPGRVSQALARADAEGGNWRAYLPQETKGYLANVTSGGLGAINSAVADNSGGLSEGRSADAGSGGVAPPDAEPGFLEKLGVPKISPDAKQALIAAGLGMMASKSHWVGPAIGEGGLQGLKTYYQNQQNTRQNLNTQSEVDYRKGQLGLGQQRLGLTAQELRQRNANIQSEIETRRGQLGINRQQVGQQGANIESEIATRQGQLDLARFGLRETRFIPGIGWQMFDKAEPDKGWQRISGPGNPSADAAVGASTTVEPPPPPSAATAPTATEPARGTAGAMTWKPQTSVDALGPNWVPKNHVGIYSNPDQLKREGEAAAKTIEGNRADAKSAATVQYQLDEMDHSIDNLPKKGMLAQGTGAKERAELAKTANSVANFFHVPQVFDESQIASVEDVNKLSFRLGAALSRQIGGREPGYIVEQAVKANPGVENTATGYRRITAGLREAANYQQDRNTFMDDYYGKFGHLNGAEATFAKLNPPQKYVERAIMSTIDPRDAQALVQARNNPAAITAIDNKYGKGTSQLILGQ